MYLGELPGMIYNPQKGRYFKKGSLPKPDNSLIENFAQWTQKPAPNYFPFVQALRNQIYNSTFSLPSAILGHVPLPEIVNYSYLKLFNVNINNDNDQIWYGITRKGNVYSFGQSMSFLDQHLNLSCPQFESNYLDSQIMSTIPYSTSFSSSSFTLSATAERISIGCFYPDVGPCILSKFSSELDRVSITKFPSDVSMIFSLSNTLDHTKIMAGTDGNTKNKKRIHLIDLVTSDLICSKRIDKQTSDVLALFSSSSPTMEIAGLRNGGLYSFDWRIPSSTLLTNFSSGVCSILKPLSEYTFLIGTIHDQLFSIDMRNPSKELFQFVIPSYSSNPSLLPRSPSVALNSNGSYLHLATPISSGLYAICTLDVSNPIPLGTRYASYNENEFANTIAGHHPQHIPFQLICYNEKPILI